VLLGYGVLSSSDGSVYQGMYHNNKRHGHGSISYGYVLIVVVSTRYQYITSVINYFLSITLSEKSKSKVIISVVFFIFPHLSL